MSSALEYTPPPPPPPTVFNVPAPATVVPPPPVASTGPDRAFLVELLIYNGAPFKDHWAYWVRSRDSPDMGVMLEAAGDVMNGFRFEINRALDFANATDIPFKRVPLQWVDGACFDEQAMLNNGQHKIDHEPVGAFEASAYKIKAPGKTLNAVDDKVWENFLLDDFVDRRLLEGVLNWRRAFNQYSI